MDKYRLHDWFGLYCKSIKKKIINPFLVTKPDESQQQLKTAKFNIEINRNAKRIKKNILKIH